MRDTAPDRRTRHNAYSRAYQRIALGWSEYDAWHTPLGPRGRPRKAALRAGDVTPLHRDPTWEEVAAFVEEHPDGARLEEIAAVLGLCRERVRQIEAVALRKLGEAMRGHEADVREWLASRGQMAEAE